LLLHFQLPNDSNVSARHWKLSDIETWGPRTPNTER
jgi:hypothetical protein